MSSLRTLIIKPDYSAASVLLSPNTCRDVFDEWVFAHQRKNLWTPHRDSCVNTCVFNGAVSSSGPDNKNLCWHLPEQTHLQIYTASVCVCVCARPHACVCVCLSETDSSGFGPLRTWYENDVLHLRGKFLHCQQIAEVGFHNRCRNLALLPFIFNQSVIGSWSPRLPLPEVQMPEKHTTVFKRAYLC